jgi:septum formation protein
MPLFKSTSRLILASASPRRSSLLLELGLDFEIKESQVDEKPLLEEPPREFVRRVACEKTTTIAAGNVWSWVLGADTIVVCDDRILGKPRDAEHALAMLQALSGRAHLVHTGFCLQHEKERICASGVVTTEVVFSSFSEEIAAAYVATGEPLDKAGAYGIQGCGGFLVERINGSYSNVVGLPLVEVIGELLRYKIVTPCAG